MQQNKIILYPSNWLYNAGVVGFLRVLEDKNIINGMESFLKDDGSIEICRDIFQKLAGKVNEIYFSEGKVASIVGKSELYRNYLQPTWKSMFNKFIELLQKVIYTGNCDICGVGHYISNNDISFQNDDLKNLIKFRNGIRILDVRLNALLAPSRKFPNSFWNNNATSIVCDLCGYILIHQHLAFTPLFDGSEIFINAPSFKLMWYLNKYSEIYAKDTTKHLKEILGMSLIEMASKFYIQLGRWEKMNIEMVSKYKVYDKNRKEYIDKIDFFSLPAEIVGLLTDKEIASLLTQIGEFKILNMVIDGKFKDILSFAEKVMRITLKKSDERTENEKDFIRENIKLERNKKNLTEFFQKLFKFYALIETEMKKEVI